jgi:CSLREA domain-containing protein
MLMTNTQHTTERKDARTLILTMMAILLALSLSLLSAQRPASASTTFTVNSTADYNDPNHNDITCDTNTSNVPICTLRAAIEQANATPGADAIKFAIPGTGVQTIHVDSSGYGGLPTITDPVTIDGYTQGEGTPGDSSDDATENTLQRGTNAKLKIELDGSQAGASDGLRIDASMVEVKGLVINRFGSGGSP